MTVASVLNLFAAFPAVAWPLVVMFVLTLGFRIIAMKIAVQHGYGFSGNLFFFSFTPPGSTKPDPKAQEMSLDADIETIPPRRIGRK